MFYHYLYTARVESVYPLASRLALHGYLGVELFFIISGFVVAWSAQGRSAIRFAKARIIRLYPEYWVALSVSVLVFALARQAHFLELSATDILLNLTMVPQYLGAPFVDGVYWTLGVEIKFYVLLAAVVMLRLMPRIETISYMALSVMLLDVFVDLGPVISSITLGRFGSLFVSGAIFYVVFDRGWNVQRALALLLAGALSVHHANENMLGFVKESDITAGVGLGTAAIVTSMFIAFALVIRYRHRLDFGQWTMTLGSLSYPVYLLHNTGKAIFLDNFEAGPLALRVCLAIAFSLAISYGVHVLATRFVTPLLRSALRA